MSSFFTNFESMQQSRQNFISSELEKNCSAVEVTIDLDRKLRTKNTYINGICTPILAILSYSIVVLHMCIAVSQERLLNIPRQVKGKYKDSHLKIHFRFKIRRENTFCRSILCIYLFSLCEISKVRFFSPLLSTSVYSACCMLYNYLQFHQGIVQEY